KTNIYDIVLLDLTKKILHDRAEIKECEYLDLIESYYMETKEKKTQDISRNLLEAIANLRYDSEDGKNAISDFKLIDEEYQKKDVFIESDEEARKIWEEYLSLKKIDVLFSRKKAFDSIKGIFYQYVISIPPHIDNIPPLVGDIGYIKQSLMQNYYDPETGYITKDTKSILIW
ncbi:MAG: CRISPR-associated helicase/endonuclease Cas3, partial [bacterium]